MKFLRNPIVTGVLVVIAVIVVFIQIVPNARIRLFSAAAPAVPVIAMATPAPAPVTPTAAPANGGPATKVLAEADIRPKKAVDREFLELNFDGWVSWPQRDPFLIISPDPPELKNKDVDVNSPVASWKLKAIYAQTGSGPLAVINRTVYGVGDEIIPGYKIIKIEGDEVQVQGPRRKERLGLDRPMPPHP
jgi:hypothetical protein